MQLRRGGLTRNHFRGSQVVLLTSSRPIPLFYRSQRDEDTWYLNPRQRESRCKVDITGVPSRCHKKAIAFSTATADADGQRDDA